MLAHQRTQPGHQRLDVALVSRHARAASARPPRLPDTPAGCGRDRSSPCPCRAGRSTRSMVTPSCAKASISALTGAAQPKSTMVPAQSKMTRSNRSLQTHARCSAIEQTRHHFLADGKAGRSPGAAGDDGKAHVAAAGVSSSTARIRGRGVGPGPAFEDGRRFEPSAARNSSRISASTAADPNGSGVGA